MGYEGNTEQNESISSLLLGFFFFFLFVSCYCLEGRALFQPGLRL